MPAQSSRSFTPKGTPASGPSVGRPSRTAASTARASASASSGVEVHEGVEALVVLAPPRRGRRARAPRPTASRCAPGRRPRRRWAPRARRLSIGSGRAGLGLVPTVGTVEIPTSCPDRRSKEPHAVVGGNRSGPDPDEVVMPQPLPHRSCARSGADRLMPVGYLVSVGLVAVLHLRRRPPADAGALEPVELDLLARLPGERAAVRRGVLAGRRHAAGRRPRRPGHATRAPSGSWSRRPPYRGWILHHPPGPRRARRAGRRRRWGRRPHRCGRPPLVARPAVAVPDAAARRGALRRNLSYGDAGRAHLLDVYRPRGRPPDGPTLVHLHGGAFHSGGKSREARPLLHRWQARLGVRQRELPAGPGRLVPRSAGGRDSG